MIVNKILSQLLDENLLVASCKKVSYFIKKVYRKRYHFLHYIDAILSYLPRRIVRDLLPIDNKKIVFMTNTFQYTCNPKYICEKLLEENVDCQIVWVTDANERHRNDYPENVNLVCIHSLRCFFEVYTAQIWIDNGIAFSNFFDKRKKQFHIQTMHGSLGIKRLDNAILSRNSRGYFGRRVVRREQKHTDLVITNSLFEENVFQSVFWKKTFMLRLGHARMDLLFNQEERTFRYIKQRVYERYGIPSHKRIVLYGPTHRRGLTMRNLDIDFEQLLQALKKKFNQEFVILFRLHNRNEKMASQIKNMESVYNATNYPDIQELMLVSDIAITDYSSWIYDFVVTYKPGFIYATDLDRYNNITGLYYLLEETPFPVSHNNWELLQNIQNFELEQYQERVSKFLAEKESVDDGHASERIVSKIQDIMASSKI